MEPWNKSSNFIFPTKHVIPKSLKFSHWPSKYCPTYIRIPYKIYKIFFQVGLVGCPWPLCEFFKQTHLPTTRHPSTRPRETPMPSSRKKRTRASSWPHCRHLRRISPRCRLGSPPPSAISSGERCPQIPWGTIANYLYYLHHIQLGWCSKDSNKRNQVMVSENPGVPLPRFLVGFTVYHESQDPHNRLVPGNPSYTNGSLGLVNVLYGWSTLFWGPVKKAPNEKNTWDGKRQDHQMPWGLGPKCFLYLSAIGLNKRCDT